VPNHIRGAQILVTDHPCHGASAKAPWGTTESPAVLGTVYTGNCVGDIKTSKV
jgi:hypothetical protein